MARQDDIDAIVRLLPATTLGMSEEQQRKNLEMRSDTTLEKTREYLEQQKEAVAPRNKRMAQSLKAAAVGKMREFRKSFKMTPKQARIHFETWVQTTLEGQEWLQKIMNFLEPRPDE